MDSADLGPSAHLREWCLGSLQWGLAWQVKRITAGHVGGKEAGREGGRAGIVGRDEGAAEVSEVSEEVGQLGEVEVVASNDAEGRRVSSSTFRPRPHDNVFG